MSYKDAYLLNNLTQNIIFIVNNNIKENIVDIIAVPGNSLKVYLR